jgi:hypothetical protein
MLASLPSFSLLLLLLTGFNPGSALGIVNGFSTTVARVCVTTTLAGASGGLMTLFTHVLIQYKVSGNVTWDVMVAANGALAGKPGLPAWAACLACLSGLPPFQPACVPAWSACLPAWSPAWSASLPARRNAPPLSPAACAPDATQSGVARNGFGGSPDETVCLPVWPVV